MYIGIALISVFACVFGYLVYIVSKSSSMRELEDERLRRQREAVENNDRLRAIEADKFGTRMSTYTDAVVSRFVDIVDSHRTTLLKKRMQFVYFDDYGVQCGRKEWEREVDYFYQNVVLADAGLRCIYQESISDGAEQLQRSIPEIASLVTLENVMQYIEEVLGNSELQMAKENVEQMSGDDFEVYCADALERSGWDVTRKGGTGDQGVDLIAKLGELRIAVQCKRYSSSVGNKAVQEVAAGRQFEQCDMAIVVSNAYFTPSARQLASALGVLLLHYIELETLRERVEQSFSALVSGEATA